MVRQSTWKLIIIFCGRKLLVVLLLHCVFLEPSAWYFYQTPWSIASHDSNSTIFYLFRKPFYHYTIPFYSTSSISNFYFPILLNKIIYLHNKIIFLHNKIIYPPITIIYSFFLILSIQQPQILQKTPSPHAHHRYTTHLTSPPATHNLPSTPKKKKTNYRNPIQIKLRYQTP